MYPMYIYSLLNIQDPLIKNTMEGEKGQALHDTTFMKNTKTVEKPKLVTKQHQLQFNSASSAIGGVLDHLQHQLDAIEAGMREYMYMCVYIYICIFLYVHCLVQLYYMYIYIYTYM